MTCPECHNFTNKLNDGMCPVCYAQSVALDLWDIIHNEGTTESRRKDLKRAEDYFKAAKLICDQASAA